MCRRRFQVLTTPITRASHPSHCLKIFGCCAATSPSLRSLNLCLSLGDDSSGDDSRGHGKGTCDAILKRHASTCLRSSLHAVRLFSSLLFAVHGHHGKELERSGGALGHGTGPWDAITGVVKRGIVFDSYSENFVDIDMNARNRAVDGWMVERETQSMYWEQPSDAFEASMRSLYRRASRSLRSGDA